VGFEINKTELVWPGKYDDEGNLMQPPKVSLPFQVIERVNETRATREAKKAAGLSLFDMWDGANEGSTFEDGWRNKLIWGENSIVLTSLLDSFSGSVSAIYIDPPFATGLDFGVDVQIGEDGVVSKEQSILEETAYRDTWGRGDSSWLSMLWSRLTLSHSLLTDDGSIFVHVDWRYSAHVRLLLNEVFGQDNFRNEIIWGYYGPGSPGMRQFNRKHDAIFWYTKSNEKWIFNADAVRIPHHESTAGKYKSQGTGFGGEAPDFSKGKVPEDWWGDIPIVARVRTEISGYPTQKPLKLLERIISASTNPGDLVLDFFGGSGTTAVASERLGRRWISADLGRYAIHTTRKRLLDIEKCKPFEVLNLGKYERQFWSSAHFGEDLDDDGKVNLLEYIAFILKLYGADPLAGSPHLHGRKGDSYVYIGSVSNPITIAEIEAAVKACAELGGKKVHVLGWEWEMGLHDPITGRVKKDLGISLEMRQIPREVMESEAVRKGQIKFFELAYVNVEVTPKGKSGDYICRLLDFSTPNSDLVPAEVRDKITKWSDYVDYWAVDWNFQNDTFNHGFVTYRTRHNRALQLESDPHTFEMPGIYQVLVKVIDIFGNDTSTMVEVKVK
jgi:16S rRNA G966 N2-methylase RsmD